jgi:hypothetical protein
MDGATILYDFDPDSFVELCRDARGVRVELVELTGIRARDVDEVVAELRGVLVTAHRERPDWRRIVVWTDAAWLATGEPEEYVQVRDWLEEALLGLQNPWRLPATGQVGMAVLQGALPEVLEAQRLGERRDLGYERERPPERRAERRPIR